MTLSISTGGVAGTECHRKPPPETVSWVVSERLHIALDVIEVSIRVEAAHEIVWQCTCTSRMRSQKVHLFLCALGGPKDFGPLLSLVTPRVESRSYRTVLLSNGEVRSWLIAKVKVLTVLISVNVLERGVHLRRPESAAGRSGGSLPRGAISNVLGRRISYCKRPYHALGRRRVTWKN